MLAKETVTVPPLPIVPGLTLRLTEPGVVGVGVGVDVGAPVEVGVGVRVTVGEVVGVEVAATPLTVIGVLARSVRVLASYRRSS